MFIKTLLLCFIIFFKSQVFATDEAILLIKEMELLYKDLPENDKSKLPLTFKLADLHFNQATIDKDEGIDKFHAFAESTKYYQLILKHPQFQQNSNKELESLNIYFQLGRLNHRFKEYDQALKYFKLVLENEKSTDILRKESALFLAELNETLANLPLAEKYYEMAISLCSDVYSCSYIHFKLAWVFYRSDRVNEALASMEKTLFDQEGNLQEKSIRDYLLFSAQSKEIQIIISKVTEIQRKSGRADLLEILGHNFYASGNRSAGTKVFAILNESEKKFRQQLRLLEEYYGDRNFESFALILTQLETVSTMMPLEEVEKAESLNTFRRLIVQLDSERKTNNSATPYLKRTITVYLKFYAFDELREKMVNGWLNANTDQIEGIEFLTARISEEDNGADGVKREKQWRLKRLVFLQEVLDKKNILNPEKTEIAGKQLLEDASRLAVIDTEKSRKWNYIVGKTYYDLKNYNAAKPIFLTLSDPTSLAQKLGVDEFAIKSQNLVLDIYNQEKNFAAISTQVGRWIGSEVVISSKDKNVIAERESQEKLAQDAHFEFLVTKGNTQEALQEFITLCKNKIYTEKSCLNAKSIAQSLNDRKSLLVVYELEGDLNILEQEYEYQGYFGKAAELKEKKLTHTSTNTEVLQVAILYELEARYSDRDRLITKLLSNLAKAKAPIAHDEASLLISFFKNTGFMSADLLKLSWSQDEYSQILTFLFEHQLLNSKDELKYFSYAKNLGIDWEKAKLSSLIKSYEEQKKISFYGANSRALFSKRVARLTKLKESAQSVLDVAQTPAQIIVLALLEKSYSELTHEIQSTPLPDGLTEEELVQVTEGLKSLSSPFAVESENYNRLKNETLSKIVDKDRLEQVVNGAVDQYLSYFEENKKTYQVSKVNEVDLKQILVSFQSNPASVLSHEKLMSFYKEKDQQHLATFIRGRLESLKKQELENIEGIKK